MDETDKTIDILVFDVLFVSSKIKFFLQLQFLLTIILRIIFHVRVMSKNEKDS